MHKPFIYIYKKIYLDARGHWRFASPFYNKKSKGSQKIACFSLGFDNVTRKGKELPILDIRSERELLIFIKDNFGVGDYRIFASVKGERGLWVFWKGQINDDGYLFDNKEYNKSEVVKLERELAQAEGDEREMILEELNFTKEIEKDINKEKKYGLRSFLRPSGKRGIYHAWEEEVDTPNQFDVELTTKPKKRDVSEMSMDEINAF